MNTTIIISVYKDTEALGLILDSLNTQTVDNFDIVISEDGQNPDMREFINSYRSKIKISHISQPDKGWRKNIALNNAIAKSTGEYLVFVDGDIVPYKNFVKHHIQLSQQSRFLSGRRVELGPVFSYLIRKKWLSYRWLERLYLLFVIFLFLDKARHIEEGLCEKDSTILKKKTKKTSDMSLMGCNFSCSKSDLELINGFDEDFDSASVGEDTDLPWRFSHFGITSKSVRYIANVFHLYHKRNWGDSHEINTTKMRQKIKDKRYRCLNGLQKTKTIHKK